MKLIFVAASPARRLRTRAKRHRCHELWNESTFSFSPSPPAPAQCYLVAVGQGIIEADAFGKESHDDIQDHSSPRQAGSASDGTIELACRFARRFGAHLEVFHAKPDPRDLFAYSTDGFGNSILGDFVNRFIKDLDGIAAKTMSLLRGDDRQASDWDQRRAVIGRPRRLASASWRKRSVMRRPWPPAAPGSSISCARPLGAGRRPAAYRRRRADVDQFRPAGAGRADTTTRRYWRWCRNRLERLGGGDAGADRIAALPRRRTGRLGHHHRRPPRGQRRGAGRISRLVRRHRQHRHIPAVEGAGVGQHCYRRRARRMPICW